jgi:hypothetical protein
MLKIKSILLSLLAFSFFTLTFVSTQAAPTQKYPELCRVLSRTIAVGDTGNDVKRLQIALGQEGIAYIGSTGYFGPVTKSAVQIFQLRNGIRQTGAVGPLTLARMQTLWCLGQGGGGDPSIYNPINNTGTAEVSIAPISSSYSNVTIGWSSRSVASCDVNGTQVQTTGQQVFNLSTETTFTISCQSYNGSRVTKSIVLRPNQSITNLPTINLSINPTSVLVNTYATLYWTSNNAYSCTLNGQSVQTSGSQQILVTGSQTAYQLTCISGSGQQVSSTVYANPGGNTNTNISSANIYANISNVNSGQPVTLTWNSNNTSSCTVTGGTTTFSGTNGSQVVYPTQTTTYRVSCYGLTTGPQVTNQVLVTFNGSNTGNMTSTISANPANITYSAQPVSLTWSSTNATYCNILNSTGGTVASNRSTSGSFTAYPTVSGNYQIICYNSNGQSTSSYVYITLNGSNTGTGNVTVNTNPISVGGVEVISWNISTTTSPQGIILSLYDANNNFYGNITRVNTYSPSSSFSWTIPKVVFDTSNDGVTCITVDGQQYCGGSPKQVVSGSYKVRATLFTPSNACFGFCQPVTGQQILGTYESANFTINTSSNTNNITATLNSNPNYVYSGQGSLLSWSSANATYCNILNSTGATIASNQSTSGTYTVYPTVSGNYQVTCFNGSGQSISDYEFITVNGGTTGNVTSALTATPNSVSIGQAVTLNWSSTNANYCNITGGTLNLLNQPTYGSYVVYPTLSTNYQISCYNNNGQNGANYVYVTTNNTSVVPTANINASSQNVTSGHNVTLSWYSANADTCSLYGNNNLLISNQNTSGTYLVSPTQTTNYQITCTNNSSGQTANNYVTVTVNGGNGGTANLSVISNINRNVVMQIYKPAFNSCTSGYVDWGDGQNSNYTYPHVSYGSSCQTNVNHFYYYPGTFTVRAYENNVIVATTQIIVQ